MMHKPINYKELKEIQKQILKGISLKDQEGELKTLVAFDLTFKDKKTLCTAIVLDIKTLEVLEEKHTVTEELMPYSPNLVAFREGPAVMQTLKELETKVDIIILEGHGAIHPYKVGLASYVGVLSNKPCIGITKELIFGRLDEDRILYNEELKGKAIKTKEHANPIYIVPGHKISIEKATSFTKSVVKEDYKMPYPVHLAHKMLVRLKKDEATFSEKSAVNEKEKTEVEA